MPPEQNTYPPLDRPKPIAENVWIVDSGPMMAMGIIPLPVRMTIVRLRDGSLWVHSPTQFFAMLQRQLEDLGPIRHFVAPNSAHWTFLEEWQARIPGAVAWAAPGLKDRAQVKRSSVRLDHELARDGKTPWDDEIEQIFVDGGGGFCEVCFFHRPSETLILTDLVQNMEPEKLSLPGRIIGRIAGVTAPDGRAPVYLRSVIKKKGEGPRNAARRLVALSPQRVVFAHGACFEDNAAARLATSLDWLL
ncbi:hypothetical protein ASG25_20045 [Rhizobium sp. Leaf384]|uniref:DUF4336 domain-containing protein n=1 Tax=unclassified Rhizobium TaxID=2613769 RepID=UPI0007141C90|nr:MULTISPECIES: DUF4336 domain-containing protein [unclassified Rhizobium]KQR73019.1 hypothetical protein ASG03_02420 [Rhizobium sp. Leaf341]KQS75645.1 hypothetical protein ASG25_20045 [Rhizobium sp. Leaf384]KQS75894.1 hypothetical protein ASG58_13725 [Rhizobium sp. Leaf383]